MIIDCHGHVSAPAELWAYKASVMSHRGAHGKGKVEVSDDDFRDIVGLTEPLDADADVEAFTEKMAKDNIYALDPALA